MRLLIDCYNLLHTEMPPVLAGLDERRLCSLLANSRWDRGPGSVVVVADGGVKPGGPGSGAAGGGVRMRYSGPSRSADEVLIELVEAASAPRRVTVVSTDREIRRAARKRHVKRLRSDEFIAKLAAHARRPLRHRDGGRETPAELLPGQAEAWMRAMGLGEERIAEVEAATSARLNAGPVVRPARRVPEPTRPPAPREPDPNWPRGPEELGIAAEDWAMVADLFRRG